MSTRAACTTVSSGKASFLLGDKDLRFFLTTDFFVVALRRLASGFFGVVFSVQPSVQFGCRENSIAYRE